MTHRSMGERPLGRMLPAADLGDHSGTFAHTINYHTMSQHTVRHKINHQLWTASNEATK